jgi:hypothetical protein
MASLDDSGSFAMYLRILLWKVAASAQFAKSGG